jgi:hypothetical protein
MHSVIRRAALATVAAVTLAAGAAACDDSNAPDDGKIQGRYVLVRVNDAPLPFIVSRGLVGATRVLTGATLAVQSNGRVLDVRDFYLGPVTANAPSEVDSTTYAYTQRGDLLLVQRPRINPALTHVDTGRVVGDEIVLTVRYVSPTDFGPTRATLLYRRER